jgi:aspartyl-tRNA(Asn)/glutamyl-tRNA(Gln) amidotransferase subunit A
VKDEFHIKGMRTAFRGENARIEPEDATVVRKLREAGAIIVGKTYMPVGGVNPPTRNPWNLEHTPGGSSSGSGAVVGARVVPVAVAEQSAGSALRPAAYCGVTAIKPSYGRISRYGCYPFGWSRDTVGLIGLNMVDLALVLAAVAGPDPLDPTTIQEPAPPAELQLAGVRPPRLGVLRTWFPERTEDYMNEAVEAACGQLSLAGATVHEVSLPEDFDLLRHATRLVRAEAEAMLADAGKRTDPAKTTGVEFVPATFFVQARRIRTWMLDRLRPLFTQYDGLVSATTPGQAPLGLQTTGDPVLLDSWTFLGFPAITLNAGLSPDGLPLGLQVVGGPRADHQLLQTGAWCEQVLGVLPPPPLLRGLA